MEYRSDFGSVRRAREGPVSRRAMLKRGGALAGAITLLGGGQLAASAAGPAFTAGAGSSSQDDGSAQLATYAAETALRLDVPMDGNTWVINRSPGVEPDAPVQRGDPFMVSGRIFPGGSFEAGLESAHEEGSIGTWNCRGWFYFDLAEIGEGAVPHVVTTQLYLLDSYDGLVSDGMEGGIQVMRTITGGYGKYSGARGEVVETPMGTNDTFLNLGGGVFQPAFNVSFEFRLLA